MKWIKSGLASDEITDRLFLEGSLTDKEPSGIWLIVDKHAFQIVDCNKEYHTILAEGNIYGKI